MCVCVCAGKHVFCAWGASARVCEVGVHVRPRSQAREGNEASVCVCARVLCVCVCVCGGQRNL